MCVSTISKEQIINTAIQFTLLQVYAIKRIAALSSNNILTALLLVIQTTTLYVHNIGALAV